MFRKATLKYYVYVSHAKIDMLAAQLGQRDVGHTESSLAIGLKGLFSFGRKKSRQVVDDVYRRLRDILKHLENTDQIGPIESPADYVGGTLDLRWGVYHIGTNHPMRDLGDKAPVVFVGRTARACILMFGSPRHLTGRGEPGTGVGVWSASDVVHYLLSEVSERDDLPTPDAFKDAVHRWVFERSYGERLLLIWERVAHELATPEMTFEFVARKLASVPVDHPEVSVVVMATPLFVAMR